MTQSATHKDALWPLAPTWSMAGSPAAVEETHISVIVLVGDRAVKLKQPVVLPFLESTDRAAREAVCHCEVELNRRLTPDALRALALDGPAGC